MNKKLKQNLILSAIIFVMVIFIFLATVFIIDTLYQDKFYPGVKIAKAKLGGLNLEQAEKIFQAKIKELNRDGQIFFYQNKQITIYPVTISASDPDLTYELMSFQLDQTLQNAYQLGRGKNFLDNIWQKIKLLFTNKNLDIDFELKTQEIKKILANNFSELEKPGQNPQIEINLNPDKINISQEKLGLIFDYGQAVKNLESNLASLNFESIELNLILDKPDFNQAQVLFLIDEIEQILNLAPITIHATTTNELQLGFSSQDKPVFSWQTQLKSWTLSKNELKDWLDFSWNKDKQKPELIFKQSALEKFLESIKKEVERPVKEAEFKIKDNKVVKFQASESGLEIEVIITKQVFEKDIIKEKNKNTTLVVKEIEPQIITENVNELGIKELLGQGQSNFSGSPKNRRHNIKIGAESLNGLLIKPEEEFSLNQSLGKITPDKGYLPELVIKGTRTVPEYGGGLCQIGTTMFRLAINTGLEITERKPHAYRVVYYEPAGTDATIYSPHPDLKFKNDTPAHLLLQTRVEGDELIFEFWGTHDGRQVATTSPKIFNITQPGPTRYIETTDLEPEKVNCIESAHNGADTEFTRIITYTNGETKEEIWQSHYRPWQAVCLVGIKKEEDNYKE